MLIIINTITVRKNIGKNISTEFYSYTIKSQGEAANIMDINYKRGQIGKMHPRTQLREIAIGQ